MTDDLLSSAQRRVVAITWATYAAFYLGRLNLSPALPLIAESLDISLGEVGILGMVFFWCFAAGQVINGQIGNYIRPHRLIFSGILLIALANIAIAFQSSLWVMAVLSGVNGFAQAAGWGPMLRILSSHLAVSQKRRLSMVFSMSFPVGIAVTWGLSGMLIAVGGWRMVFWVPGIILIFVALLWHWSGLDAEVNPTQQDSFQIQDFYQEIRQLSPLLVAAAAIGFIYIGIFLWLPTFIQEWDFLPQNTSHVLTALVPLVGIPGMLIAAMLLARQSNLLRTIMTFLSALLTCLFFSAITVTGVQVVFVLMAVMIVSALAGLLLSSAPMLLAVDGRVSSAGGLLAAVWSISGGLASTIVGSVAENSGWMAVFILWIGFTLVAMGAIQIASHIMRQPREKPT